ncbi:MAG: methylenetetrahydrofolate reductase [NAD(P)H] [bacterium]|nr:methylenetetrahydrofolate reductase [NAD(P)H] [Gammaproteobacteria bacterium]HIL99069.1 methylenetetrahydrofolate reductase [NAD(P)H] [Pseudomonadales bacterium]
MANQKKFPKHFSFEFSAPKSEEAIRKLIRVHDRLTQFDPHFFSVTYGAGGSTKDGTRQAVLDINESGSAVAPHLSFGGDSPDKIEKLLIDYKNAGVRRLVALRGDMPSGIGASVKLTYANELVSFIREKTGDHFHIKVAAYPEVHPDSNSVESDLKYFKAKVDAGANSAITQYFYNAEAYFRYIDACEKLGIDLPIIPGIMPITNFKGLVRFSDTCGADIPRWIRKQLEDYQDDPESLKSFGEEVVTRLCEQLLAGGAPGLHIYTLNQSLPTIRLWHNLGL